MTQSEMTIDRAVTVVACGKGHSGNRRLAQATGDSWSCQGCGAFYRPSSILARADQRGGENMSGGLYYVGDGADWYPARS